MYSKKIMGLICAVLVGLVLLAGCGGEATSTTAATAPVDTTKQFEENWGISFVVEDVTAAGLTLICTQNGESQQLGTLMLDSYMLYSYETNDLIDNKEGAVGNYFQEGRERIAVEWDDTDRISVDWSEPVGTLPSGRYTITVTVLDVFDKESIQTTIAEKEYHQDHTIEFAIP